MTQESHNRVGFTLNLSQQVANHYSLKLFYKVVVVQQIFISILPSLRLWFSVKAILFLRGVLLIWTVQAFKSGCRKVMLFIIPFDYFQCILDTKKASANQCFGY